MHVTWVGNTTSTQDESECGFTAVGDLLGNVVKAKNFRGFTTMKDNLLKMGYQVGLTLHAFPYDWRLGIMEGGFQ